jgi:hypothetical protein
MDSPTGSGLKRYACVLGLGAVKELAIEDLLE